MLSAQKKSKLTWRCRRGMLELDLLLNRFLELSLPALSEADYAQLETFLNAPDPDLYAWLMGYEAPSDEASQYCVKLIQSVN